MIKILSNDRFVAVWGSVPAGDFSDIVKLGVGAVRQGFGIVPCHPDTDTPMCTLTAAAAKKDPDHECYHVITDDKQARTILNRLTRGDTPVNLAVDLATSNMTMRRDDENPTVMYGDEGYAWLEGKSDAVGHELVPPSTLEGVPLTVVGQTNPVGEEEPVTEELPLEGCGCEDRVSQLEETVTAIKSALVVALTELQELKNR